MNCERLENHSRNGSGSLSPHDHPLDETEWDGFVELYSQGSCHVLALADAEIWAERFSHFQVITNPDEMSWVNPDDPDDGIEVVVHVYAVFRRDDRNVSLDVFGLRDETLARDECGERYSVGYAACENDHNARLLYENLTERDDPDDPARGFRPLHEVRMEDIEEAKKFLGNLSPKIEAILEYAAKHPEEEDVTPWASNASSL